MNEETWTCPSCSRVLPLADRICPECRTTQVRPRMSGAFRKLPPADPPPPPAEPVEVNLPHVIKEARFNVPHESGPLWTSGVLLATEQGVFLLSEKDALDPAAVAATPLPPGPQRPGPNSLFFPRETIQRVVHDRLVGQFLEIEGKKVPLRFSPDGWKDVDAVCDKLGLAHQP